jgi:hypothetical protein
MAIHVVCGTCKVKIVKTAFKKQAECTVNHPYYYKDSYFEFLKSLVQNSEGRSDILTVPFSLSEKRLVVLSTSMRQGHKQT